jgi:hypothetical protein
MDGLTCLPEECMLMIIASIEAFGQKNGSGLTASLYSFIGAEVLSE